MHNLKNSTIKNFLEEYQRFMKFNNSTLFDRVKNKKSPKKLKKKKYFHEKLF